MARRRVQYGVVDASDADVGAGAPGFRTTWHAKEDLKEQLMEIDDVPKDGRLYFWDGELWLRWEALDDLPGPEQDPLRIKVVRPQNAAVRTLDDVTLISEATARAINRLKREEESEQEETISCTASSTPFVKAEAAARQLGFQVRTVDCELATNAHEQPLEPDYIWEHDEDSAHEKGKMLARLTHELHLSSKTLQATAVFAKPLGVVQRGRVRLSARTDVVIHPATATFRAGRSQLDRFYQLWELKTSKALQTKRSTAEGQALVQFLAVNILTDRAGWGVPVVLSDLAEATVFQRGNEPKDIFHVQFQSLQEAYAHIRWLLDSSKAENPILRLDTSRAPPAAGMFTIMEHEANLEAGSTSSDARLHTNEYDATDDNNASFFQKDRLFTKQLYWLAAKDERVSAFLSTLSQNQQRMPSILDFVPSAQCG